MIEPTSPDGKQLRSQLEDYKLIVEVNQDLLDKNISSRDDLAAKLAAAQGFIDQLEQPGEEVDYHAALNDAIQIIEEIRIVIKVVLSQDTS